MAAERDLRGQAEEQARHKAALRSVLDMIGATDAASARARLALAAKRAEAERAAAEARAELEEKGDGLPVPALREEAALIAPDDMQAEIDVAVREQQEAVERLQCLAGEIATKSAELGAQAREAGAEIAAADQQAAIASLSRVLDEAVMLHLGAVMLGAALSEIEGQGSSAALGRIGAHLAAITGGAIERVTAEPAEGGSARMIAFDRIDGGKQVSQLSEGTRDQLFLALRLAVIEDHVATSPALPFVADDLLQAFDDDRALAAMRALLRLSDRVQVILLSHHRHLAELAEELPTRSVHLCEPAPLQAAA